MTSTRRGAWALRYVVLCALGFCALQPADAYCNGMRWTPRTSKAFPPGWNGLAKTPFRGWRSWYAYYTRMNQEMIEEAIDALAAKNRSVKGWEGKVSLCDLGYCSAGIDEGWEGCGKGVNGTQHYLNGTPAVNTGTFPDMRGLVEYGHSKGLKMGWYFNGCGCIEKREPASGWDINYEGDIALMHEYGFDAVKFDGCGRMCNLTFYADLMQRTGKAYDIENCHWGDCTADDASSCPTKDWCPFNWYRTSGDSNNALGTWYNNLQTTIRFQSWDEPVSQPGCWAYPDMLQVGRLGCSSSTHGCPVPPSLLPWTRTHFAGFCIISSPLVLSIHPSDTNLEPILDIIGNKMAMEINQAWAGHPGSLVRTLPPNIPPSPPIAPGSSVVSVKCDAADATQLKWTYDASAHTIQHAGLCLSTEGWDLPLNLRACGNTSTHQNFTYDASTKQFSVMAPAGKSLLKSCLQAFVPSPPQTTDKTDVWKCVGPAPPQQQFTLDNATGALSAANGVCLAARDKYVPPPSGVAGVQLWAKPLDGGRTAALFINGGALNYTTSIGLAELNVTGSLGDAAHVTVTDVWTGKDAGAIVAGHWSTGTVAPMDSRFVVFETETAA